MTVQAPDRFVDRHNGPREAEVAQMLAELGLDSLGALIRAAVPGDILTEHDYDLPAARTEREVLADLGELASQNRAFRSYLGLGYHDCVTPPVILRNVLENPAWYTQYTPYQAEISQGRLEALLNFQTLVADLTGMEVANSSMLDEATSAAEVMTLFHRVLGRKAPADTFLVDPSCHPQTVEVIRTRAAPLGIEVVVAEAATYDFSTPVFGVLLQVPSTEGAIRSPAAIIEAAHDAGALVVVASDLLALTRMRSPGSWGADAVVGNSQRLGVPMGFGGPHAAFLATRAAYKRQVPGRIVGVSKDSAGRTALRLALQTREQHIRRDRATSNICTAQVLLAVIASMYAVYHGPEGLQRIADGVIRRTRALGEALAALGYSLGEDPTFDTLHVSGGPRSPEQIHAAALEAGINLRAFDDGSVGVSLDETTRDEDVLDVLAAFGGEAIHWDVGTDLPEAVRRDGPILEHPVFSAHRSETDLLRYIHKLSSRDLSLTTSMIPLGSCTMKLNATAQMVPVTWAGFGQLHPFAPTEQTTGYRTLFSRLEAWLAEITGFSGVSLQPNAGSQGEYAGLLVIRAWHRDQGDAHRNVCLIPSSAHGTNPASAVMAGMKVVVIGCDDNGNIDLVDLAAKAGEHKENLAALMVTYPSTHGVFETTIREICDTVHAHGGQVYIDGANMNAMVGLCRPGEFGGDVIHLNLHKTFAIPHGGGGPGMGPIAVAEHLVPYLPGHALAGLGGESSIGAVSAAPWGSASILPISYAYIALLGVDGVRKASEVAILNANYVARRLEPHFPVLYRGAGGWVAHECIIDVRPFKAATGIEVVDVAKRLMDYGFHAPTMSWPVAGTLMIEPTESESKAEIDRFCDALISIRGEIQAIADGEMDRELNPLKRAPHTASDLLSDGWDAPYSRELAAFPAKWTRDHKFWPVVGRIDDAYGDRNLVCACPPIEDYVDS